MRPSRAGTAMRRRPATLDPSDIAAVAVTALTQAGHHGKIYPMTGEESLGMLEQTEILGEVIGRRLVYEMLPDQAVLGIAESFGISNEKALFLRYLREAGTGP
ncbi:MAG TPA: hypothetical protein VNO21_09460, partial [Polyangiaceae bacterium]|nr:hypothetical protein [Polyangiaceae bacterium]